MTGASVCTSRVSKSQFCMFRHAGLFFFGRMVQPVSADKEKLPAESIRTVYRFSAAHRLSPEKALYIMLLL